MEKAKHLRQKRLRRQRRWAALFIVLTLAGGGAALHRAAGIMAAETRCGQVFASVAPGDGVLDFTVMGRSGILPYAAWGRALAADFGALAGPGRLLLWGCGALRAVWQQEILPFAAGLRH